jgi:hypothetical protein
MIIESINAAVGSAINIKILLNRGMVVSIAIPTVPIAINTMGESAMIKLFHAAGSPVS